MSGQHTGSALDMYIPGVSRVTEMQIKLARLTVCDVTGDPVKARELLEILGLVEPVKAGLLAEPDDPE